MTRNLGLSLMTLACVCLLSNATAATADRPVSYAGVTSAEVCQNWTCYGTAGTQAFSIVPLLSGETSADVTVTTPTGLNVKMTVIAPGGASQSLETTGSGTLTATFSASTGDVLKVWVYDPTVEHQTGSGVNRPIPFTVDITIHS
jgi:hypothetical protein